MRIVSRLDQRKLAIRTYIIDISGDYELATAALDTEDALTYLMGGPL